MADAPLGRAPRGVPRKLRTDCFGREFAPSTDFLNEMRWTARAIRPRASGEVRNVDHGQKQAGDPEQVLVGEHRTKTKRRDDLILNFLSRMGDVLGQMMKPQIQETERENNQYQERSHCDQRHVG